MNDFNFNGATYMDEGYAIFDGHFRQVVDVTFDEESHLYVAVPFDAEGVFEATTRESAVFAALAAIEEDAA